MIDGRYERNLAEIFRLLIAAGAKLDPPAEDPEIALSLLANLRVPEAKEALSTPFPFDRRTESPFIVREPGATSSVTTA